MSFNFIINSWDNLKTVTEQLADQLDRDATALLQRYDNCLEQALDQSTTAIVLVSREPLLSPNRNSWASDFLTQFNVQNLAADLQGQSPFAGYVTLSPEKVLELNPDRLILVDTGTENESTQLQAESFWQQLKAVETDQVETFEYFGLINPGSLTKIEQVCHQLGQSQ